MYCPCGLVTLSPRICANHLCRDNLLLCHSRQSPASPETFAFGSREKLYCKLPTLNQHIDGISTQCAYDSKLTKKNPLPSIPIELNIVFVFVRSDFLTCTAGLCLLLNGATAWLHLVVLWSKCGGAESQMYSIFHIISHPHEKSSIQSRSSD